MKKSQYQPTDLESIPGVGPSIAQDLRAIGINFVADLIPKDPEILYEQSNKKAGVIQDRCLLYVFRGAVYYAKGGREAKKLRWWYWKNV